MITKNAARLHGLVEAAKKHLTHEQAVVRKVRLFTITMKDPSYLADVVVDGTENKYLTGEERKFLSQFLEYDEYITIEFDPEAKTARVVPIDPSTVWA